MTNKLVMLVILLLLSSNGVSDTTSSKKKPCNQKNHLTKLENSKNLKTVLTAGNGLKYRVIYNKHGAILQSNGKKLIYIGKNCDAFSKIYGKGVWGKANGGFIISFSKASIGFPRQEVFINNAMTCDI